jgi:hypothetical protein
MTPTLRTLALALLALVVATPATAQFGIKKKLRAAATGEKDQAAAPAGTATAGTLVLDDQVVAQLIKGLQAAKAHREAAAKADTPYGRYLKAKRAYADAQPKCEAGKQTLATRMAADPKFADKNGRYLDLMMKAMENKDTAAQRAWGDSIAYLQDPACTVKDPQQPSDWYEQQRAVETGAQQAETEASGMDGRESGQAKDRAIAIIQDAPPPDVSPSEQQAVEKREKELKELMGLNPPPEERKPKPAPAAAPEPPPPTPTGPTMTSEQQATSNCMVENSKKHQKELERLGQKMQAASQANDMATVMAIADTVQRLQSAGCTR